MKWPRLILFSILALLIIVVIGFISNNDRYDEFWISLFFDLHKIDNPNARDISSQELLGFLKENETSKHQYNSNNYFCLHFAYDLHNEAEKRGIRSCIVLVKNQKHSFNAFNTTDRGLVFVDISSGRDNIYRWNDANYYKVFHFVW